MTLKQLDEMPIPEVVQLPNFVALIRHVNALENEMWEIRLLGNKVEGKEEWTLFDRTVATPIFVYTREKPKAISIIQLS